MYAYIFSWYHEFMKVFLVCSGDDSDFEPPEDMKKKRMKKKRAKSQSSKCQTWFTRNVCFLRRFKMG